MHIMILHSFLSRFNSIFSQEFYLKASDIDEVFTNFSREQTIDALVILFFFSDTYTGRFQRQLAVFSQQIVFRDQVGNVANIVISSANAVCMSSWNAPTF